MDENKEAMAAHEIANLPVHSWPALPVLSGENKKRSSSSWADLVDEPPCCNEPSDDLPLPTSDVLLNDGHESHVDQWDGFDERTLPASNVRRSFPGRDNRKYWADQVATLRRENADLFNDKQWALSQAEQLRSDRSALLDENVQLRLQLSEAERAIGAWTAHCGSLEDALRWQGWEADLAFRVDVLEQRLDKVVKGTDSLQQSLGQAMQDSNKRVSLWEANFLR
eukprot:5062647-Karenia_brevis.AAC.1